MTPRTGRVKPAEHQRLKRATLVHSALPAPSASWSAPAAPNKLFANDKVGCCTKANLANLLAQQLVARGVGFNTQDILDDYFDQSGGADNGLMETDVLSRAQERGFPLDGRVRLAAVLAIDPHGLYAVQSLCEAMGGLYVGAELPVSANDQLDARQAWTVTTGAAGAPGSWSGHAMALGGFNATGPIFKTWGALQQATWDWWMKYVDECYVVAPITPGLDGDRLVRLLGAAVVEAPV